MPCCGGKDAGKPISRWRWLAGHALFLAYHVPFGGWLWARQLVQPRYRDPFDLYRHLVGETWADIRSRRGIRLHDDPDDCTLDESWLAFDDELPPAADVRTVVL